LAQATGETVEICKLRPCASGLVSIDDSINPQILALLPELDGYRRRIHINSKTDKLKLDYFPIKGKPWINDAAIWLSQDLVEATEPELAGTNEFVYCVAEGQRLEGTVKVLAHLDDTDAYRLVVVI
jgi:hypothetical protein